jgi:hypothetical protein
MRPNFASLLFALALACPLLAAAAPTPEDRLSGVFAAIEANRLDDALKRVDELIRDYPNFRLAHLVRGDLLLARSRPLLTFGNVVKTVPQEKVDDLRAEALVRLLALRDRPESGRLPRSIVQLHPGQRHALLVDSRRSRLYVFANAEGRPRLIADFYYYVLKREGLGLGDAKLLALIGALLGYRALPFVLFVGAFGGALISIPILLWTRRRRAASAPDEPLRHAQVPFGPFLAGAALAYVFVGPRLFAFIAN